MFILKQSKALVARLTSLLASSSSGLKQLSYIVSKHIRASAIASLAA